LGINEGKKVKTIPATLTRFTASPITEQKKRRGAGDARVSTDHDDQFTSYEAQIDYYTNCSRSRDDWEFVDVYTDEGITGTSTKRREGFKRMVADALAGRIDLIVTKSVSRFARNTVDSLTTIRKLKENGVTIIYISHRMEEIFDLSDHVSVLRDGAHIATLPVANVTRDELVSMMVGRAVAHDYPRSAKALGEVVLEARGIKRKGVLNDISFQLRRGEVLGVAGLVGAGRTELARAVLGIDRIDAGEILLHGKPVKIDSFRKAIGLGLSLVPEDRKSQGLVQIATVSRNICMVNMDAVSHGFVMAAARERQVSQEYVEKMDISTPNVETEAQYLSGGNQQKVVIAKWLLEDSEIVILDEPTRGIDVGAKSEIHRLIVDLAEKGKSILMISSELPEIVGMSDRVMVIHEGNLVGEFKRGEATPEKIMALCI